MIRVLRPRVAPAVLKKLAAVATKKLRAAHARGEKSFAFDRDIYADPSVKQALRDAQHGKCCFCESKIDHVSYGHVEHFRPKAGVRQRPNAPLQQPGYFWLAYAWTNLLFACELCNSRFKGSLFPLLNPGSRARRPADSLDVERPLFIDPSREDPGAHIGFRKEYPYAVRGSRRGKMTWHALGLDREALADRRRDHLKFVEVLVAVRDGSYSKAKRAEAASLLESFASDAGQWSAMVRAALRAS